jgi:putative transposase
MARPLRIEYPGAFYHVTSRGNERKDIFKSQRDREKFLSYLESATEKYGAILHAYCLMGNHYHLMVETPHGNLAQIMKHINSAYATYYNVKRQRSGHLLQGRYHAILVEASTYAVELSRYIHLNPVRAKIVATPETYPWSSYRSYTQGPTPSWLTTAFIHQGFGQSVAEAQANYQRFVHERIGHESTSPLRQAVAGTILGTAAFVEDIQRSQLRDKKADRDLPALKALGERTTLAVVVRMAEEAFPESGRLARKVAIHLCHRYGGRKLRDLGELFNLTDSGITRSSERFAMEMALEPALSDRVAAVAARVKMSNA